MHLELTRSFRRGRGGCQPLLGALVAWATLSAICRPAGADEWRGWRGLEREGRSGSASGPVHWSPERNVAWKTPIPGKGHSSPVVAGDSVVVTTAYPTQRGQLLRSAVAYGVLALAVLLPFAAAPFVVRCCRAGPPLTRGQFLPALGLCVLAGVVVHGVVASHVRLAEHPWDAAGRMDRWLFSSKAVVLCLMFASLWLRGGARGRLAAGLLVLAFGAFVVLGRPAPGNFALGGPGRQVKKLFEAAAAPLIIGLTLLCEALFRRRRAAEVPAASEVPPRGALAVRRLALASGALLFGLTACGVPLASAARLLVQGKLGGAEAAIPYRWTVIAMGRHFRVVVGACLALWLVVRIGDFRPGPMRVPGWLVGGVVALGAAQFVGQNYPLVRRELVRAIVCVDRRTGAVRWVREGLRGPRRSANRLNSPATPTAVVEGGRVYAWFGTPGLLCTDLDGNVLWTNRQVPYDGLNGVGASPVPCDGRLVIVSGQPKAPYITALDGETGRRLWTATLGPWKDPRGQHRTPTVKTVDGREVVLYWGWEDDRTHGSLWAFDAESGRKLWKHPIPARGEAIASVVSDGDTLYLPGRHTIWALSLSKLSRGEKPVVWKTDMKRKGPNAASPVLCGGLLFTVSDQKHLSCLDAKTGELVWQRRLAGKGPLASLVAIGNRVYVFDRSGLTTVLAAERAFRKLAENRLPDPIVASPAPVDGRLFIRTAKHLWCIREP